MEATQVKQVVSFRYDVSVATWVVAVEVAPLSVWEVSKALCELTSVHRILKPSHSSASCLSAEMVSELA